MPAIDHIVLAVLIAAGHHLAGHASARYVYPADAEAQLRSIQCSSDDVCANKCMLLFGELLPQVVARCWCYQVNAVTPYCRAPYDFYNY